MEAKRVIYTVAHRIFCDPKPLEESIAFYEGRGELADMDNFQRDYIGKDGIFLVMVHEGRVIGTGAIRRLADDACELKRLWFLTEYQGRGLGYQMLQKLLSIARSKGYKVMRLETDPQALSRAVAFYQSVGFYEIPPYGDDPISMEMLL